MVLLQVLTTLVCFACGLVNLLAGPWSFERNPPVVLFWFYTSRIRTKREQIFFREGERVLANLYIIPDQLGFRADTMGEHEIQKCVEAICNKGCQHVRNDIDLLEKGEPLPEVQHLSGRDQQSVLKELKSIMSVYGDSCRV
jgi:hypothetical protein